MDGVQNWKLELNRRSNWQDVYRAAHQQVSGQTRYPLIPAFEVPVLIDSPIIAVTCRNLKVRPTWRRAGWLNQAIPGFNPGAPIINNEPWEGLDVAQELINLNNSQLVIFPMTTESYYLWFEPVKWLPKFWMNIWSYHGPIADKYADELEALKVDIARVEFKLDRLNQ